MHRIGSKKPQEGKQNLSLQLRLFLRLTASDARCRSSKPHVGHLGPVNPYLNGGRANSCKQLSVGSQNGLNS